MLRLHCRAVCVCRRCVLALHFPFGFLLLLPHHLCIASPSQSSLPISTLRLTTSVGPSLAPALALFFFLPSARTLLVCPTSVQATRSQTQLTTMTDAPNPSAQPASATEPSATSPSTAQAPASAAAAPVKAIIKNVDMAEDMQQQVIELASDALTKFSVEKDIAAHVKRTMDQKFGATWHAVVGKNYGSYVTHETKHFIYFYLGQIAFLLWRA
ncbi:Dynein light chain [Thecaphora frezii]